MTPRQPHARPCQHDAMSAPQPPITQLLHAWQHGDRSAFGTLVAAVQAELRRMASSRLRGGETPSLGANDLLQETLLKLMQSPPDWQDRAHFFGTVSMAMRSVLVDHARARQTDKRGGQWQRLTYTVSEHGEESNIADLLTLDALLTQLARADPRGAEILQLTYFGGLKREDIAAVLGLSVPTVDRELRFARAWLARHLQRDLES